MTQLLEVVRAGAGAGKTYDLCQTVAEAVEKGLDSARILATTFTRKAAAELKGRIQSQLLLGDDKQNAHHQADRLELAAIGTVHSVAHQLLSRYAIDMGLSPRLEVVTETAGERALRNLLGAIPDSAWQPLGDCAKRLGVKDLHRRILDLLAAKRGNRVSDADFQTHMAASADRVCEILAPTGPVAKELPITQLFDLAEQALADIDGLADTTKVTAKALSKLRQLKSNQICHWGSHLEAMRIAAGKSSGADGLLDPLRTHASQVRDNPRLHADVREFSKLLAAETIRLDSHYMAYKTERGLVDFTDLETLLLVLLENETLAARLAEDFDLVLVDEFQDTNPLQLSIFQRLRQFSPRSRWVGDPKQAIYGFRDTDPDLVNDIWKNAPDASRTELPSNYRSQRGLVQLVGTLFEPVFGADARQTPQRPAEPRGVERWVIEARNNPDEATAFACGISKLHAEGVRFGDIAILSRTNRSLSEIAGALDDLGIPYLRESPGLLATREGAMALAGLRLVADRSDSLAAATVLHLLGDPAQDTPDWIMERLKALQDGGAGGGGKSSSRKIPWHGDPRFERIEKIDHALLSPSHVTQQVIEAIDLPALVSNWNDPARRCANLDSMLRHVREYEELAFDAGRAATLSGLILHLENLADEQLDVCFPPQGHDAVNLVTYHSAKGLEWPIVVLAGLNSEWQPGMWSPVVTGGGRGDADPLEGRNLRSWTWPFGMTDGEYPKLRTGSGLETDAITSPEGQERADREAKEQLRLLYVGCTRARDKLVFAHRDGKYAWLARLSNVDSVLDCSLGEGDHELAGIDTSLVIRHLQSGMADACRVAKKTQERWLQLGSATEPVEHTPRFHSPSQAAKEPEEASFQLEELPGPSHFPSGAKKDQYAAIGDAVHGYLAALPSMRSLTPAAKESVAIRCLEAFSVTGVLAPSVFVASGERFAAWVEQNYPEAQWHVEISASGPRAAGGNWNGTIDLVLQLPNGNVVIIDHKSAPITRDQCEAKAGQYTGQLAAYTELLTAARETVESTWIHFALAGVVARRD